MDVLGWPTHFECIHLEGRVLDGRRAWPGQVRSHGVESRVVESRADTRVVRMRSSKRERRHRTHSQKKVGVGGPSMEQEHSDRCFPATIIRQPTVIWRQPVKL